MSRLIKTSRLLRHEALKCTLVGCTVVALWGLRTRRGILVGLRAEVYKALGKKNEKNEGTECKALSSFPRACNVV